MSLTFCPLASGSKGNSYLVSGNKTKILIDAGLTAKAICQRLNEIDVLPEDIDGIVVTHEHSDHISAIKVLAKNYNIPVFANEKTMFEILKKQCLSENKLIRTFTNGESFYIGEFDITPFRTPHDSACSCGFSVFYKGNKVTVATDIGHMTRGVLNACENSDILVLEANHDEQMLMNGPYSQYLKQRILGANGHLPNSICGKTAAYLLDHGLKQLVLAHLSEENNTPQLAYDTVKGIIEEKGAVIDKDVYMDVAQQHSVGKCYRLE